jgi:hypothetical protein
VFGTARPGNALAAHRAGLGVAVRAVSVPRPAELAGAPTGGLRMSPTPQAAADAVKGASAVYQCVNAPYTQWPLPAVAAGVLAAAERTGARLVVLENLYGYGPTGASR